MTEIKLQELYKIMDKFYKKGIILYEEKEFLIFKILYIIKI